MIKRKFDKRLSITLEERLYNKVKEHKIQVCHICRFILEKAVSFIEQPRKSSDSISSLDKELLKILEIPLNIQE